MAVVVPSTDVPNFELYNRITTLTNAITAAGSNGPLATKLTLDKANTQFQLVLGLLGSGKLLAVNVLAAGTYAAAQDGGDQI